MAWGSLTTLVTTFAPKAFLDKLEVNYPSSTGDFTSQVGYQVYEGQLYPPPWNWGDIPSFGPNDLLVVPDTVPSTFRGGNLSDATAYVHVQAVQGQADLVDIQYWLFYNFNGAETLRVEGTSDTDEPGEMNLEQSYHWGDWECVTVRVNSDLQAVAVCFSQHSTEQWCLPGEMSFSGTQPNVYVSRGTHANRPVAGGPFWIKGIDVGLATVGPVDYAEGDGEVVDYSKSFVIVANDATQYFPDQPPDPGWLRFQGRWGQPLSVMPTQDQILEAIEMAANSVPSMKPFIWIFGIIAAGAVLGNDFFDLFDMTQNAPTNPPSKGLWQKSLPLNPPLSSKFTPALAPFALSEQENQLSLVYVLNDGSNQIYAAATDDIDDWTAPVSVRQTSSAALCLAPFNGGLCLAFISNDINHKILTCLSTDGQTWTDNAKSGQTSPARPALAEFNGKLWLAFIANDSHHKLLICSSEDGKHWSDDKKVIGPTTKTDPETTSTGPALAAFNGSLWVAFIANNSSNQVLVCSSADGENWSSNSLVSNAASAYAPALTAFDGKLRLAFVQGDATVQVSSSPDGLAWSTTPLFAGVTSQAAPALAVFNETLWLACINSSNQITLYSSTDGMNWSDGLVIFPPPST